MIPGLPVNWPNPSTNTPNVDEHPLERYWTDRPKRIQRRRTKGWRMPEGAVYVGRRSDWENNYPIGAPDPDPDRNDEPMSRQRAVDLFAWTVAISPNAEEWAAPLRGHDLACWCPLDQPCHADVLLEQANRTEKENP